MLNCCSLFLNGGGAQHYQDMHVFLIKIVSFEVVIPKPIYYFKTQFSF